MVWCSVPEEQGVLAPSAILQGELPNKVPHEELDDFIFCRYLTQSKVGLAVAVDGQDH